MDEALPRTVPAVAVRVGLGLEVVGDPELDGSSGIARNSDEDRGMSTSGAMHTTDTKRWSQSSTTRVSDGRKERLRRSIGNNFHLIELFRFYLSTRSHTHVRLWNFKGSQNPH
jgi:hypothetical protein